MGPAPVTREEAASRYLYPSGNRRMACPTDNDGFPTCMGDGGLCGYSAELKQQVCIQLGPEKS